MKLLADFVEAQEFSHFGSELAPESQTALARGKMLYQLMNQKSSEHLSVNAQSLALDIVLHSSLDKQLDVNRLKDAANEAGDRVKSDDDFAKILAELTKEVTITGKE